MVYLYITNPSVHRTEINLYCHIETVLIKIAGPSKSVAGYWFRGPSKFAVLVLQSYTLQAWEVHQIHSRKCELYQIIHSDHEHTRTNVCVFVGTSSESQHNATLDANNDQRNATLDASSSNSSEFVRKWCELNGRHWILYGITNSPYWSYYSSAGRSYPNKQTLMRHKSHPTPSSMAQQLLDSFGGKWGLPARISDTVPKHLQPQHTFSFSLLLLALEQEPNIYSGHVQNSEIIFPISGNLSNQTIVFTDNSFFSPENIYTGFSAHSVHSQYLYVCVWMLAMMLFSGGIQRWWGYGMQLERFWGRKTSVERVWMWCGNIGYPSWRYFWKPKVKD